jgi:hypothetical protein
VTTIPVLSDESVVADVGTAASVRVAVRTKGVLPSVDEAVADDEDGVDVAVAFAVAFAVPAAVAAAVGRLEGVDPPAAAGVVRLALCPGVERVVVDDLVEVGLGFAPEADGGRVEGGLPAPNAHPSTVPGWGCVPLAPTVLYDQLPPGDARQYDQYAVVGAPLQGSGRRSIVHTMPCWRGRYAIEWPADCSAAMPLA